MLLRKLNYSSCTAMYCNYAQNVSDSCGGKFWRHTVLVFLLQSLLFLTGSVLPCMAPKNLACDSYFYFVFETSSSIPRLFYTWNLYLLFFHRGNFPGFFLILAFSETKKEPAPFRGVNSGFT